MSWDLVVTETASTNDLAREAALAGAPDGAWISARRQTGGRGRLGREWRSLEGNLFLSMIARECPRELWSWIPLAAGVGAARAVAAVAPEAELRLKWPNDLRVGPAKLGGILCEAAPEFVVIGLGLNCVDAPEGLDQKATSLSAACGRRVAADQVRPIVVEELRSALARLARNGAPAIREEYERLAELRRGDRVEWGPGTAGELVGLGEHGELLVRIAEGKIERLYAEEVTGARRASGESPA
jgi:BirA family transcriptional regulator, biotin operon repressor / biotin---[acetyl-CoA-carboxylase] ligase